MKLSVIIPTLNEAENIGRLISRLQLEVPADTSLEILVVDADSEDDTADIARKAGARVIRATKKGRACQMNQGAREADGDILYFVHGDTLPPIGYVDEIFTAINNDINMGCFRFRFDSDRRLLKFNSYMTRFKFLWVRGGDQSLFINKTDFQALGEFREDYIIMEDFEFLVRAKRAGVSFKVLQKDILVSARKYSDNSYLRVQLANALVFTMFRLGFGQKTLANTYKSLLN
ncbi:MAG: glycosyltransferase family 2 protein [Bacteroidetes bacterium]|nr:glycosyltransferase family 2 protein [Bacteroidota bacterium]